MTATRVELATEVAADRLPLPEAELATLLERAVTVCGLPGAVSLALVDDVTMRRVNRDYHACDETTDVLAFPLGDPGGASDGAPGGEPQLDEGFVAEIVVSFDTAEREAATRGVDIVAEILLYVVHGTLHLLGYDDHEPEDARKMHGRTLEVLDELGYRNHIEVDEPTEDGS